MKRRNPPTPNITDKKQRLQGPRSKASHLKEVDSIHDQAGPYRLVTAKFPIDSLTPVWTVGANRPIDDAHKQRLCEIFEEQGVLRKDLGYRLRVACTKAQVQKMLDHINRGRAHNADSGSVDAAGDESEYPSFKGWDVIIGEKAELMAGNHRVEALKEYLRRSKSSENERWWICDVYDKDTLPPHLHIKLRANREDLVLPDNHGQIWAELATLSSTDSNLFQGSNTVVERQMLDLLGLSGRVKFPVRRLGTIWRNKNWRPMITKWCEFSVGQATFNISTFEWMASCRIDDFWFNTFNQVINSVSQIRSQVKIDIQPNDWVKLASLPHNRTTEDIQRLFYPESEGNTEMNIPELRRQDFFPTADNKVYEKLYEFTLSRPDLSFPNIHSLLKTTKQEGKVMSIVMSHVGQWLNRNPAKVAERDSNKPPLRNDLIPALQERHGEKADEQSLGLQNRVLEYVRDNIGEFTCPIMEHYLQEYPYGDGTAYTKRFEHESWKGVLIIVLDIAGPHLQHDVLLRYNTEDPKEICSKPASAIAQAVCKIIGRIPEVLQNPALNESKAMDDLRETIEPLIVRWVAKQCARALESPAEHWQPSTIKTIEAQHAKYVALVKEDVPLPAPPNVPDNPPMSDGELRGGSAHSTGSSVHESEVEQPNTEGLKDGPTAGHMTSAYRRQAEDPLQLTPEGLQELQSLHRNRTRLKPQNNRLETRRVEKKEGIGSSNISGSARGLQPTQPQSSNRARGSRAWRNSVVAQSGI